MSLPIRTTLEDIDAICNYLATKPTGATVAEARTVIDAKFLDGRKLSALKFWQLVDDDGGRLKLTDRGRRATKDRGVKRSDVLKEMIRAVAPYNAVVERAKHSGEYTVSATDVAAHWHQHFKDQVSSADKILNDQAVCFFQIAQGADLGTLVIGRKGQPTRFDFNVESVSGFVGAADHASDDEAASDETSAASETKPLDVLSVPVQGAKKGNRVFITHGKNRKILDQVKEIVVFGKFDPVVAQEHETTSKPVPDKVLDDMRSCQAAVIHVGSEGVLIDDKGKPHPQVNGNVLIEIGAAMALYGRNFILLVEEGVELPSNLQGLYECRYKGGTLDGDATMKLLKAFNEFR